MILKLSYAKLLPAPAVLFLPCKKSPAGYQIVIFYMIIDPNGAKISIIKREPVSKLSKYYYFQRPSAIQ